MSVLGGLWHFDGKPVDRQWLAKLSTEMAQHGPDGEYLHVDGPVGLVYRPFHTTAESRRERQPWISPAGNVIVWDGRLDNADDLRLQLDASNAVHSEVALALLAFERWGVSGLERLRGDFALSIWQPGQQKLLLARDYFAVRPLFYHLTRDRVFWCSDLARLVLQPGARWTLDDSYIAGYLASSPETHDTPYREIRAVGPACCVEITAERVKTNQFWRLDPDKRRDQCRTDEDFEEAFRHLFRQSVRRRLRSDKPVLAQLSGGMDSSSIVCVADDLLAEEPGLAPRLDTITHYDASEPTGDERDWAKYVEARRGRPGHHLSSAELTSYRPPGPDNFLPVPGGTEGMLRMQREYDRIMTQSGARVLLSGLGGDEFTGGVPYPVPQLADLLVLGRWLQFARLLKQWSAAGKRPAIDLAWQSILCFAPAPVRARWSQRANVDAWLQSNFARLQRIGQRKAGVYHETWRLLPTRRVNVSTWQHLAGNNGGVMPVIGQRETRMPFMDRDLVEFLTSIPQEQLLCPGFRRSLMRRALTPTVPAEVFGRRQKAAVVRGPMAKLAQYMSAETEIRGSFEVVRHGYADADRLREAIRQATMIQSDNLVGLLRVLGVEHWLRDSSVALSKAGCTLARHAAEQIAQTGADLLAAAHAS